MPDMQKLQNNKEKIISIIRESGPSYPARLSRATGISSLFISAFLAELVSERRLKLSDMKIGSSPLYYIEGQEEQLEKFIEHLNPKEKEALHILKQKQILEDEKQTPAVRVALRKIKDFAFPIQTKIDGETRLFWRFFLLPENELKQKIQELISEKPQTQKPKPQEAPEKKQAQEEEKQSQEIESPQEKPKPKTKPKQPINSDFANSIREYLSAKDIEVLEDVLEKKKEFFAKIRTDTLLGKQEYYLVSKDKKKINTNDLTIALQQAQTEKMPALIISPGELDKKAKSYLQEWRNLIKFEKVNF